MIKKQNHDLIYIEKKQDFRIYVLKSADNPGLKV